MKNIRLNCLFIFGRIPARIALCLLFSGIIVMTYGSFWKSASVSTGLPTSQFQPAIPLVDAQGQPNPMLLALLKETGVDVNDLTLETLVERTQKRWFQGGKERWLINGVTLDGDTQKRIINLFEQLGLMQAVDPQYTGQNNEYDCVLVHGALAERMKMRLDNVEKMDQQGVHFKAIAFLTGERALVKGKEDEWIAKKLTTETQVMEYLWQEKQATADLKKPVHVISAPVKEIVNKEGEKVIRRPGTEDTIQVWLNELRPQPGSKIKILAISNQPYVRYQHAILERCLKQYCLDNHYSEADFHIETIGDGVKQPKEPAQYIAICLDNLARCLYEAKQLRDIQPAQQAAFRKSA